MPSIVYWSEDGRALPSYTYTFGFVTGKDDANRFSAIATVTQTDEPLRMIFADEQNQFWEGLAVEVGDIRRDVRIAYSRQFGRRFAVDVAIPPRQSPGHYEIVAEYIGDGVFAPSVGQ